MISVSQNMNSTLLPRFRHSENPQKLMESISHHSWMLPAFHQGVLCPPKPHSLKPVPRLARAGYGTVVGEAVDPGAVMELKEDGVPWNVPMPKEGGRVFTVWDATCCKRGKTRERKRRHGFTPTLSSGRSCRISPEGGSTRTRSAGEWKQDGSPRRAGSGRQRGPGAYT